MMGIRKLQFCSFMFKILFLLGFVCDAFTPIDNYLIDCGSPVNVTVNGRVFVADTSLSTMLTTPQSILANTTSNSISSSDSSTLYETARIFTGPSSYSFQIQSHGRHFIRLHFFPFSYESYNLTAAQFTVSTQDFVLLNSFRAPGGSSTTLKEFSLNITRDTLILSFIPLGTPLLAFINAIEVVSVPDNLILDAAQAIDPSGTYQGLSGELLETVYRINMGGPKVTPSNDTLWRTWINDAGFLLDKSLAKTASYPGRINHMQGGATEETAPDIIYSTATQLAGASNTSNALFNVSWQFDVIPSNAYLVRMHFCDFVSTSLDQLYFNVYIGDLFASQGLDLSTQTDHTLATAYFVDFVVSKPTDKLEISIGPSDIDGAMPDGILNGLEIMKMNSSGLAVVVSPTGSKHGFSSVVIGSIIGAIVAAMVLAMVFFIVLRRRRRRSWARNELSKNWLPFSITGLTINSLGSNGTTVVSGQNGGLGFQFSFSMLQEATNSFDEDWVIGVGGFGKVYKGVLRNETKVAVKRGNPKSQQGLNEFRTEIELLSRLRHRHLVSLIGYCDEGSEMILVYEYMENGTLKSHLYGSDLPCPSWKQRLEICIGSARGLHYLHTGQSKAIIHRDVKSANILLDENLMAKVADFGLSKTGPELDQTHVSTAVKGSFGYLDPEYFRRQQLTEKSDVYSFGVVLLEVLCARLVLDPTLPRDMVNLAEWGMRWQKKRELDRIMDPRLSGTIRPDSLRKFGETVEKCLADYGVDRPSMGDVLWNLEYALQLQEVDSEEFEENSINRIVELSARQVQDIGDLESVSHVREMVNLESTSEEEAGTSNTNTNTNTNNDTSDLSDVSMSRVFSQLIKSEGR